MSTPALSPTGKATSGWRCNHEKAETDSGGAAETGIGFTLSPLSPYDSYSLDFSLGYIPQSGSGSANFKIYGNAPTDLWSYSLSSSLEFDKFGFKQTYNELTGSYILSGYNSSYLGFGNSASIFYGRQFSVAEEYLSFIENFTTPFYSSTKYDMTDRLLVYNQSRIGVGISRKEGINISNMSNQSKGDYAITILDVEKEVSSTSISNLQAVEGIIKIRVIK